jgi:hypothetical protein
MPVSAGKVKDATEGSVLWTVTDESVKAVSAGSVNVAVPPKVIVAPLSDARLFAVTVPP